MTRIHLWALVVGAAAAVQAVFATDYTVTSSLDDGAAGTLRHTVLNLAKDGDRVLFDAGVTSITLGGTEIAVSNAIEVVGSGVVVSGNGVSRIFNIFATATDNVTLSGLTLTNGYTTAHGGGIYADRCGTLTMTNCTVAGCAALYGGGLKTDEGITLRNCSFIGNLATAQGGGVHTETAETILVDGGTFANNTAQVTVGSTYRGGGAIGLGYYNGSLATIQGGTLFTNNQCLGYNGGAVYAGGNANGVVTINGATFVDNVNTIGQGGALWMAGTVTLNGCTFLRNRACVGGGGVATSGRLTAIGCDFESNVTTNSVGHGYYGGAIGIRSLNQQTVVSNCVFRFNSDSSVGGGAIGTYFDSTKLLCYSSRFEGNRGPDGGAIRTQFPTELYDCTFLTNSCTDDGGALMVASPTTAVVVANCTFSGNIAGDDGGAICGEERNNTPTNFQPRIAIYNSTIVTNRGDCGGVHVNRNVNTPLYCTIRSSIVAGNLDGVANDDLEGEFLDITHSLIGESPTTAYTVGGSTTGTTNGQDPKLGPLTDNGGPALPGGKALLTYALLVGSPALNAGSNPLLFAFDQRGAGFPRETPTGVPDIGAYEYTAPPAGGTLVVVK